MGNIVIATGQVRPGFSYAGAAYKEEAFTNFEYQTDLTRGYIESYNDQLQEHSQNLSYFVEGLKPHLYNYGYDYEFNVRVPAPASIPYGFPDFPRTPWPVIISPRLPALDTLAPIGNIDLDEYPRSTVKDPGYEPPEKPVFNQITPPGDAPDLEVVHLPEVPVLVMPPDPVIDDITIREAPDVIIPPFDARFPNDDLDFLPVVDFDYNEELYNSEIWAPLVEKVVEGIRHGGTGLDAETEALIFESAQYRMDVDQDNQLRTFRRKYAGKGFDIPHGAFVAGEQHILAEFARNRTELNSKVVIEQAELAQKNTHFMIEKGITMEQIIRGFHDAQMNRTLDAAKASAQIAGESANMIIARYNARVAQYEAELAGYETQLKAAFADLEAYKIEMEGKKIASDVQKNIVEIYTAQVGALEVAAKMYTAQVEGAKAAAEVENLKMQNYKITVEAYVAELEGERVKYSVYATEADVERIKVQTYSEQIKAYLSELEAIRLSNAGKIEEQNANISANDSKLEKYKAEFSGFDSQIRELASSRDIEIKTQGLITEGHKASAAVAESQNRLYIEGIKTDISGQKLELDAMVAKVDAINDGYKSFMGMVGDSRRSILNATAQLLSSSMSSLSTSISSSDNMSRQYGASQSLGNTLQESHTYGHQDDTVS